jgi:hypothetical protein
MIGSQAVTDLAVYIRKNVEVEVFKYEKPEGFKGSYICVNKLPTSFGDGVNTSTIVNVNVHVHDLSDQRPDTKNLETLSDKVAALIPTRNASLEDDDNQLIINGCWFELESDSNFIKDTDGTHFVNLRIQVTFVKL